MAKEFALKQFSWDGNTIDAHERAILARAMPMDFTGHQFFARPCFTPAVYTRS